MAIITSAQSGNFNATTTWVGGVVPVDGDNFIIASGHTVTYNVATPVTNGFQDSTINGVLQHQSGTSTTLRMNGRLTIATNGTYHMRAGAKLQFKGTAAESHNLYINNQAGASFIAEGSDGMPVTTLASTANEFSTSFNFTSAANFAVGEWFAIYNNTTAQTGNAGNTTLRDEGFWVHDINSNTVYFRQFVGPESTIISSSGSTITVANAKVFRVGQSIIFGTGANRNVQQITNINYTTNVITLNSSVTGTVTGLTVYETRSDKIHVSGDKVRKIATVTTVSSASTSTSITVANANMFAAGDEIWVEARSECGGSTDGNWNAYSSYVKTVQSVAGNVITLTGQVGYNVVQGALVTRLTRDVVIEPITANTDYTAIFAANYTSDYTRKLIMKDVFLRNFGSSQGAIEGGVYLVGHFSTNSPAVTLTNTLPALSQQAWLEGISMTSSNTTRDLGGFWMQSRYSQLRAGSIIGIFNSPISFWYSAGQCAYNCITSGSNTRAARLEGSSEWAEYAYNYSSRNYHGPVIIAYETGTGYHHNVSDANNEYGALIYSQTINLDLYKWKLTGSRFGIQCEVPNASFLYSQIRNLSGYKQVTDNPPGTNQRGFYYTQIDRGNAGARIVSIVEDNFEYDKMRQLSLYTERIWDNTESSWRVYNNHELNDYGVGWFSTVFVPSNVSVVATCAVKLAPNFSGNYPSFEARTTQSNVGINQLNNSSGNWGSWAGGGSTAVQYTAAATNAYETAQITVSAVSWPRQIQFGVHVDSSNVSEGYWMRPIFVFLSNPYSVESFKAVNIDSGSGVIGVNNSAVQNIIRIGGMRLN